MYLYIYSKASKMFTFSREYIGNGREREGGGWQNECQAIRLFLVWSGPVNSHWITYIWIYICNLSFVCKKIMFIQNILIVWKIYVPKAKFKILFFWPCSFCFDHMCYILNVFKLLPTRRINFLKFRIHITFEEKYGRKRL